MTFLVQECEGVGGVVHEVDGAVVLLDRQAEQRAATTSPSSPSRALPRLTVAPRPALLTRNTAGGMAAMHGRTLSPLAGSEPTITQPLRSTVSAVVRPTPGTWPGAGWFGSRRLISR